MQGLFVRARLLVVMCAVLKVSAPGCDAWLRSEPSACAKQDERLEVLIGDSRWFR